MAGYSGGRARGRGWLVIGIALLAAPVGAAVENVALGRPYVASDNLLPGWTGLTDGVSDSDEPPGCFAMGSGEEYPKQVVIDLGALCTVSRITVQNSRNGNTRHVSLWVSPDAQQYERLREYYFPSDAVQTLAHSFAPRRARYVKVVFHDSWQSGGQGAHTLFLREVQVFGERPAGGLTVSGQEELRLMREQEPLEVTPAVQMFRRYRASQPGKWRIGVLGDGFAAVTPQESSPWAERLEGLLEAALGPGQVELLNLAAAGQTPEQGLRVLGPLRGEEPVDAVLVAYGWEAALAGTEWAEFRNAWQKLVETLAEAPVLVVAVTPPPLLGQSGPGAASVLPLVAAQEEVAGLRGLAVVRSGAVLARAANPGTCFAAGSRLSELGQRLVAEAVRELLAGPTGD